MMAQMSQREKTAVGVALLAVFFFVGFQFILSPAMQKKEKIEKTIRLRQKHLVEMREIQSKYSSFSEKNASLSSVLAERDSNFSLFSFLEKNANSSDVKSNIAYMKPAEVKGDESLKQSLVEMKLQAISLKQLVNFLELVESPENVVGLKRISIQENKKNDGGLDVLLQIVSVDEIVKM